jgi:hypothetical protein
VCVQSRLDCFLSDGQLQAQVVPTAKANDGHLRIDLDLAGKAADSFDFK